MLSARELASLPKISNFDLEGMRLAADEAERVGWHLEANYLRSAADELSVLRDAVMAAHGLASEKHGQSAEERLRRIARLLDKAIDASTACSGSIGLGGTEAHRDISTGSGDLDS